MKSPIMRLRKKTNKGIVFLVMIVGMLVFPFEIFSMSATEVFGKAKGKLEGAKTLTAEFNISTAGGNITGNLYSKGKKFSLITDATSNWYNGEDLYTYDKSAGETFRYKPTSGELGEINPLLYIRNSANYKIMESKESRKDIAAVTLLPKKKGNVKKVTVEIDKKTWLPKAVTVTPVSGSPVVITISKIKLNVALGDSYFEYPRSKYPKVKVTDMR